jgi:hypothetical protein
MIVSKIVLKNLLKTYLCQLMNDYEDIDYQWA